ncbi:macro domain-containing protein [Massilia sp. CT11-137]|uniref:macro domain-containing protein n=1 Tax=Massilia sp. CT11-137 TaxID=3393901 RepID=UPI0039AF2BBB
MTVIFCKGDIFAVSSPQAFAHGCNCAGAMGKGIAVTFREKWPLMYARYRELCKTGAFVLGDVFEWTDGATRIYNLGTQRTWRSKADVSAIKISMTRLKKLLTDAEISEIYMPRIGAGLGGGDWNEIKSIIEWSFGESPIHVYVCEEFVPGAALQVMS